jgi:hypothetical protein
MKIVYAKQEETKKLKWTKRAKKIENMHKWSTTEQGLSVHKDLKPARLQLCRGGGSLSASDEQRVAV